MVLSMMNSVPTFKVCLIGAAKTGKTTFLLRHQKGEFRRDYIPTRNADVVSLNLSTNVGQFTLNVWDIGGDPHFEGLGQGYYIQADAALIFCDPHDLKKTSQLIKDFHQVCPNAPIVNVWNKCDLSAEANFFKKNSKSNRHLIFQGNRPSYQISSLSNYNYEKPLLEILRLLTKNQDLCLTENNVF